MREHIVVTAEQYDRVDGRNAYHSAVKRLTLGAPYFAEHETMQIAAQIWEEQADGELKIRAELPIHQIFDLMILLAQTLLYFKEAYRNPLLYDAANPTIKRIGVQGGVLPVAICTENEALDGEIQKFAQSLNDLGELTGERLRTLTGIIEELELY